VITGIRWGELYQFQGLKNICARDIRDKKKYGVGENVQMEVNVSLFEIDRWIFLRKIHHSLLKFLLKSDENSGQLHLWDLRRTGRRREYSSKLLNFARDFSIEIPKKTIVRA